VPYFPKKQPLAAVPIDTDEPCAGCGYNLRGLTTDKNCPECGRPVRSRIQTMDVLSEANPAARARWRLALALLGWSVLAITARQFGWFIWQAIPAVTDSDAVAAALDVAAMAMAIAWVLGAWLVTSPLVVGEARSRMRWWPTAARWLTVLWLPAVSLQVVRMVNASNAGIVETAGNLAALCVVPACIGGWLLVMLLHRLAVHADQDDGARRLNNALWLLPPISLVMVALGLGPIGWMEAIMRFIILMLPWLWFMMWMGLSILELHVLTAWGLRIDGQKATREERIKEKREALTREASEVVRATPLLPERDVPLAAKRRP